MLRAGRLNDFPATFVARSGLSQDAFESHDRRRKRAFSVVHDFGAAEDAAQEAIAEAFTRLDTLAVAAAFPSWLARIVFKHCDRMTRRKRVEDSGEGGHPRPRSDAPLADLERRELHTAVMNAIAHLDASQRAAVTLFYIQDYSHREIAEFLGVTVGAVKNRLHAARKRLAQRMLGLVEDTVKEHAPDETFTQRVQEAIEVFAAKGPERDALPSDWSDAQHAKIAELLGAGDDGFRVAVELATAKRTRLRLRAALHFGLAGEARGRAPLAKLMEDESAVVRVLAVRAYAALVHPDLGQDGLFGIGRPAASLPEADALEPVIASLGDRDVKVRWYAVTALGAYRTLEAPPVEGALERACGDPVHKVRHAATRLLRGTCPDCDS